MSFPIASLRDDFTNNVIDPTWTTYPFLQGSATRSETGGQAVITLPSSTAGTHENGYYSAATYDITGDGAFVTVGTMVATGVAAYALWGFLIDASNQIRWFQQSGTLKAQKIVAGITTDLFSVTWSSTTHKYLRIRESGGTIFFDTSTNGTSWTNRASIVGVPFAVTALYVEIVAGCGNVASPGSFKLDEFNVILPVPSSTWRETTADWSISNRLRSVTLASDGGMQGVLVTADTMDSSRVLGGTVRYFAGPLGSSSGGFLQLTEYASLALAEASAFPIPINGRVDLPAMVDARYMRLYHRSTDASSHLLYEYVPRRLVQADDIEAESIKAINISAGAITADKISVLNLAAVSAQMGSLHMDGVIDIATTGGIYQGSGTFAAPTTGLKLFNSGGVGKLSGYNAGVEQITLDTDGKLKAGAGAVVLDAGGVKVGITSSVLAAQSYQFVDSGNVLQSSMQGTTAAGSTVIKVITESIAGKDGSAYLQGVAPSGKTASSHVWATNGSALAAIDVTVSSGGAPSISLGDNTTDVSIGKGLNVGTATGAATGQVLASQVIRAQGGTSPSSGAGVELVYSSSVGYVVSYDRSTALFKALALQALSVELDYQTTPRIKVDATGIAFFGATPAAKPTVSGSRASNAALASLLTALANLGLLTDSST